MVPRNVDTAVAIMAMLIETYTADIMLLSVTSFSYHLNENPVNFVRDFDALEKYKHYGNIHFRSKR